MSGGWTFGARLSPSENHRGYWIADETGWRCAEVYPDDEDGVGGEKRARLIAAAPDLLEACSLALRSLQAACCAENRDDPSVARAIAACRNAIAKAVRR